MKKQRKIEKEIKVNGEKIQNKEMFTWDLSGDRDGTEEIRRRLVMVTIKLSKVKF